MRIWTSCWFSALPADVLKIGVSRGTPRNYPAGFRKMMELAPGSWFKTASIPEYKQLYFEGLRQLDPRRTVDRMAELSGGCDVALLCYERPDDEDFCHRAYISAWLHDTLGIEVFEQGLEHEGCGWKHPKMPAQYRQGSAPAPLDVTPYLGAEAADQSGRVWKVVGFDPDHPNQALVVAADGARRPISEDILKSKFKPVN